MTKVNIAIEDIFNTLENVDKKYATPGQLGTLLFSNLPSFCRANRFDKVEFGSVDAIPLCEKYLAPSIIKFINAEVEFCGWKMVSISLKVDNIIKSDEKHFLSLHPVRYDLVKKAISEGSIDMPIVYLDNDDIPRVQDGRHRIIALHKFGFNRIDISVPEEQLDFIKSFYS